MNPIKSEDIRALLQDHLTNMLTDPKPVDVDYGMSLVDSLQRQHERELVEAQAEILIWATGGIKEFTEDGAVAIPAKIAQLTNQEGEK